MLKDFFRLVGRRSAAPAPTGASEAARLKSEGNAHLAAGRLPAAADAYRAAIAQTPQAAELHVNLGFALKEQGLYEAAEACLREAAALAPGLFDARYLYGMVLAARGRPDAAVAEMQAALALRPEFTAGHAELCRLLLQAGHAERAKQLMQQAIEQQPGEASLHMLLGNLHAHSLGVAQAVACYERALQLQPDFAEALSNLGLLLEQQGRIGEAVTCLKRAIALAPDSLEAHSNLLFALSYDPATSPARYLAEAMQCGRALRSHARPYTDWPQAFSRTASPLRVGLMSGGLRKHPIGYFLEALLAHWDNARIELHAYSANPFDDEISARLKPRFAAWRPIALASDEDLARLIHEDGIQVLVDLDGHTDPSRIAVLPWRPAPVQVSWLGYFASTGLPEVDWFIADPVSVPDAHRAHFCEQIWQLPNTRLCFTPPARGPEPGPLPAATRGYLTFGCFQRLPKINDALLTAWAAVLQALPQARLRLQGRHLDDPSLRERFLARCSAAGLDLGRLELHEATSREAYLAAHHEVDMLLDTLPYSGATTTCEALWMGVPTVTVAGDSLIARQGASLLACLGLDEWVADDMAGYIECAVRQAGDLPGLARLRTGLRSRLLTSSICDGPRFSAELQATLLDMWARRQRL